MAVTRYVWAVYGTVAAHERPLGKAPDSQLTVPFMSDYEGFKRSRLDSNTDDSEPGFRIQSRAIEAVVIAHKWYRKLKLLNFVSFTVETESPRAAPTQYVS